MKPIAPVGKAADQPIRGSASSFSRVVVSFIEYYVLVGRLEPRGLVRREPDTQDGRYAQAMLTEAVHAHFVKAAPGHVEQVRRLVFDVLDESEQHALRRALSKIGAPLLGDCD